MAEIPQTYTELLSVVLRYKTRLKEEAHAAGQCVKAWQAEYQDNNPKTTAYLSGKAAGFNEALLLLTTQLRGGTDRKEVPK